MSSKQTQRTAADNGIATATELTVVFDQLAAVDRDALTDAQREKLETAAAEINAVSISLFAGGSR